MNQDHIPGPWRQEAILSEAMQMLDANPDIVEDEDIALALASEVPDALKLLDAFAGAAANFAILARMTDERIDQLRVRVKRLEAHEIELREKMADILLAYGMKRHRGANGTIYLQAARPRVIITDDQLLPGEFIRITTTVAPDKRGIAQAIEDGRLIPGAELANGRATSRVRV